MSATKEITLSAEDKDVLGEILNIGAGKAAQVLSELMNKSEIDLSLPSIEVSSANNLEENYKHINACTIISIDFGGSFSGSASLLFSNQSGERFTKVIAGDIMSDDEVLSMKEGILKEVGNIVISGVLGQISSIIKTELDFGLPHYEDDLKHFADEHSESSGNDEIVIIANISFKVKNDDSEGVLFLIFSRDTYQDFLNTAKAFFGV